MEHNTKNNQVISDYENVCRACMYKKDNMTCIFSNREAKTFEKFEFCTGIQVSINDGLPKALCKDCLNNLGIAYTFKENCLHTQNRLQKAMKLYKFEDGEIKKENDAEVEMNNVDQKDEEIKVFKLSTIKEEISVYEDDHFDENKDFDGCDNCDDIIADCDIKEKDLDYKRNQPKVTTLSESCINENKDTINITIIPTGVSIKNMTINDRLTLKNITKKNTSKKNTTKKNYKCAVKKKIEENDTAAKETPTKTPQRKRKKYITKKSLSPEECLQKKLEQIEQRKKNVAEFKRHCSVCDIQFTTIKEHYNHKLENHGYESICEICGKQFLRRNSYYAHMKSHRSPAHQCQRCDYVTAFSADLDKHMLVHNNLKSFSCDHCPRTFNIKANLSAHVKRTHLGLVEKKHLCTRCGYKTHCRRKLERHMDSHDNIKRYACEFCNTRFGRREHWKKHMETTHNVIIPRQRPGRQRHISTTNMETC